MQISGTDISSALSKIHKHGNTEIIEEITEENGKILYKGKPLSSGELSDLTLGMKMLEFPSKIDLSDNDMIFTYNQESKTIEKIKYGSFKNSAKLQSASIVIIATHSNGTNLDYTKELDYLLLETFSNSVNFGEMIVSKIQACCVGSKLKLYICGGVIWDRVTTSVYAKTVEFVDFKTASNSQNFPDLSMEKGTSYGTCNELFALINGYANHIEADKFVKIDFATKASSINPITKTTNMSTACLSNQIKMFFAEGLTTFVNYYIFTSTLAALLNFGNLTAAGASKGGTSNKIKGLYRRAAVLEYFDMSTKATTSSFGVVNAANTTCQASNNLKAVFANNKSYIECIFYSTAGSCNYFGDLTSYGSSTKDYQARGASSNCHGGLSN